MNLSGRYIILLLSVLTLGLYYPLIYAPFNLVDDVALATELLNLGEISIFKLFFPGGEANYYRPVIMLSFIADQVFWGGEQSFMHLGNILLHVLNVVLIYFLTGRASRALQLEGNLLPFLAAVVFAVHPLNVEAVAWIVGRNDLLAGSFVLGSLLCLLQALESGRVRSGVAAGLLLLLGCLSKETALFFVPGALFLIFAKLPNADRFAGCNRLFRLQLSAIYVVSAIAYLLLRFFALNSDRGVSHVLRVVKGTPGAEASLSADILGQIRQALVTCGFYFKKLFIPFPLNFGIVEVSSLYLFPGILLCLLAVYWVVKRDLPACLLLSGFFVGMSALLASMTGGMWTPYAERYMYIPLALASLGLVLLGWHFHLNYLFIRKPLAILLSVVLVLSAGTTVARCLVWQDNISLFEDTVRKSPGFDAIKNELSIAYKKAGRTGDYLAIQEKLELEETQVGSLNKIMLMAQVGNPEDARKILIDRLDTAGRHEVLILEQILKITDMMINDTANFPDTDRLRLEKISWLERLHNLTDDPFYHYRLGSISLQRGDKAAARNYFTLAAAEFSDESIYKIPALKLAEQLAEQ